MNQHSLIHVTMLARASAYQLSFNRNVKVNAMLSMTQQLLYKCSAIVMCLCRLHVAYCRLSAAMVIMCLAECVIYNVIGLLGM